MSVDEVTATKKGKKTGPKPRYTDARCKMNQKNYRGHMQKKTGEGREQRLAARREYHREYTKNVPAEEKEWKRKMIWEARRNLQVQSRE